MLVFGETYLERGVLHEEEMIRCGADYGGTEGSRGWDAGGELILWTGITDEQTFFRWCNRFGDMIVPEARGLKDWESENAKLNEEDRCRADRGN